MTKALQPAAPATVAAGAAAILALAAALLLGAIPTSDARAEVGEVKTYIVVFKATQPAEGQFQIGGSFAANHAAALALLQHAGGAIAADLTREIGVAIVKSPSATFAETVSASGLVEVVGEDFAWHGIPSQQELLENGTILAAPASAPGSGPEPSSDPLEDLQWSMKMMKTEEAHAKEAGSPAVDVAVIDSGIDATHVDFTDPLAANPKNVDCIRGRDFTFLLGPVGSVGTPVACQDNGFHGTHVAGIIAARANGVGTVGVAPNVTLIPIKVCDTPEGFCYAAPSVAGITYAGSIKAEVMNMSFFTDDDTFRASTELKCNDDPKQFAFRTSIDRAIAYARGQGALPIAAAGNSRTDLGAVGRCAVVPTESPGTISVVSLGPSGRIANYSSFGKAMDMISAPGGDGGIGPNWCNVQVLSTIPGAYGCFQGTSMASPHATGLAALIASQLGSMGGDGDLITDPAAIAKRMRSTANDIGKVGYDRCYGWGRANAWRAVFNKQGADKRDATIPDCGR